LTADFAIAGRDCIGEIFGASDFSQPPATTQVGFGMLVAIERLITMLGTIRGRHLLTHGPLIVRLFGFRAYVRCVVSALRLHKNSQVTFLGTLNDATGRAAEH